MNKDLYDFKKSSNSMMISGMPANPSFRVPRIRTDSFNPYSSAFNLISKIRNELEFRINSISHLGISLSTFDKEYGNSFIVEANGNVLYSLETRLDETAAITFHGTHGAPVNDDSTFNAWGKMEKNPENDSTVLRLNDLSLLECLGGETVFTSEQFIEALWEKICDVIESESEEI